MTIKKTVTTVKKPAPGTATVADRFKLDADPKAGKKGSGSVNSKAVMFAFIAALAALGVAGLLTFTLYQHWEFLIGA